jgi:hypothetical protein
MRHLTTLLLLTLGLAIATPVLSQEKVEEGDELQVFLDSFDEVIKSKDTDAVLAKIDRLLELYLGEKVDEKEYKSVADRLGKAYNLDRNVVQIKVAGMFGNLGKVGARELLKASKDRSLKEETKRDVYLAVVRSLGVTKDAAAMKALLGLLKDKDNDVIVAAAEALIHFQETNDPTRKQIAGEMIKLLSSAFSGAKDPRQTALVEKYDAMSVPFNNTLQALTKASPGNPEDWQKWFNENKKKRW